MLQDAFSEKLRAIFGDNNDRVAIILEAAYTGPVQRGYDGLLVAERAGRIIGTLLIEPVYYTPAENRVFEHIAVRELGMPRMLWASFLLWLLGHAPRDGEAHISDLGVMRDCRGEGVGKLLVEHAEAWAREHDRPTLTLWVAESNSAARRLYEQAGFSVSRKRRSWSTRLTVGIYRWYFMEKRVSSAAHKSPAESAGALVPREGGQSAAQQTES